MGEGAPGEKKAGERAKEGQFEEVLGSLEALKSMPLNEHDIERLKQITEAYKEIARTYKEIAETYKKVEEGYKRMQ